MKDDLMPPEPEVSLCVVTHVSDQWRANVIIQSLKSLHETTEHLDREVIIWDNAGATFFREGMLRVFGFANTLVLSPNVGPYRARRALCHMARGTYLMFTDDDVEFLPNWYENEKHVVDGYEKAVVGGCPIRRLNACLNQNTTWEIQKGGMQVLERGELMTDGYIQRVSKELGVQPNGGTDTLVGLPNGARAYAHGSHMQFLCRRDDFPGYPEAPNEKVFPWAKPYDRYLVDNGVVGLTTEVQYVRHIGERDEPSDPV